MTRILGALGGRIYCVKQVLTDEKVTWERWITSASPSPTLMTITREHRRPFLRTPVASLSFVWFLVMKWLTPRRQ